ncbi:hypothetical protein ACFFX1_54815 [Dactylosporangium sucinum]|uniref:Uncharacterized protein n=1 Tax=Dactylosporangium sucinum TaxID=1424081 RepID=A0A917U2S0_9ACTN|nr:hypothetical protein [Dactylosporangium sucinum]GGM53589.1 hypothetical protein GCM10007977_063960 [Dactylosporangium sucinum]
MPRALATEHVVRDYPNGDRVLFIVPVVPDDAPPAIREGLARRRIATISGTCPCGSSTVQLTRQQRRARQRQAAKRHGNVIRGVFEHAADCPANDLTIFPLLRAWLAGDHHRESTA